MIEAGLPADRVLVVPNFVSDPGPRRRPPSGNDALLFVGRLAPEKGVDQLIEAWARVQPSGLRLVVIGDGPLKATFESRHVAGVELRGHLGADEVAEAMLGARALLFPSIWYEGQPMVLLEALAAGLPVLAPHLGGVGSTLGDAAHWVEEGGWETALKEMGEVADQDLDALGERSRRRYEQEFTPPISLAKLTEAYRRVTG
jgi:glycosyltransferase involved in cell wall biosynthesis